MIDSAKIRRYFEDRLSDQRLSGKSEVSVKCPFHKDRSPSLSVNLDKGMWQCHAGCGNGGMITFEMKFSGCDEAQAKANISKLLGGEKVFSGQTPEAIYPYHDANGRLLFEKLRMPGKRFTQRKPDGNGGYEYKIGDVAKPLYRLPDVLVANEIAICEGEKDADNVRALGLSDRESGIYFTATTNFDGAGKWRDEYSPYLAGKRVVIFPDNDEIGRKHGEQVARSVAPYASGVKIVTLPGLAEKGDVSDFLASHSAADLVAEIKKAPQWKPAQSGKRMLVDASDFMAAAPERIDWLIENVIERGSNGFVVAVPKGGKSWAACDMLISLALGCPWLEFHVPRPVRCALISREDNPAMTAWRLRHLFPSKQAGSIDMLRRNLYVNSRKQSPELMLDNPEHVSEIVSEFKAREIEFAIFDVFNVLHAADENDNTQMRAILRQLTSIQSQTGAGIGVVHHFNKAETGGLTQRMRGASSIAGWAEWLIGISMADDEMKIRRMEFELKASQPPDAVNYRIDSDLTREVSCLVRTQHEARATAGSRSRAAALMQ